MSSTVSRAAAVVLLVASIAASRAAVAEARDPDFIAWSAPDGCPDAAHVRADVARLGGEPSGGAHATVIVMSRGGRWIASIAIEASDGAHTREVEGATCDAVADATALVLAIAFRPSPSPSSSSSPSPSPSPASSLPRQTSRAESPSPSRARAPFAAGFAATAFSGALPSAAPGAGAWLAFLPGRVRLELAGTISTSQSASILGAPIGADFRLLTGAARACGNLLASDRFALAPCAGVEAIRITATGFGMTASRSTDELRAAASFGALATWAIERAFALRLEVDGVVPTARPRFVVEGDDGTPISLHRPAAVWGRLLLGAEIRF